MLPAAKLRTLSLATLLLAAPAALVFLPPGRSAEDALRPEAPTVSEVEVTPDGAVPSPRAAIAAESSGPVGRTLRYALALATDTCIVDTRTGPLQRLEHRVDGELHVRLAARDVEHTLLVVDVHDAGYDLVADGRELAAEQAGAFARSLEDDTVVRLDAQGRITGYRFAPGANAEAKSWIRAAMAALHPVLDGDRSEWEAVEADSNGTYRVRSRREPAAGGFLVTRDKLEYLTVASGSDRQRPPRVHGRSEVRFDDGAGWFAAVDSSERLELIFEGLPTFAEQNASVAIELVGFSDGPLELDPHVDLSVGEWAGSDSTVEVRERATAREARERERLASVRLEDVVATLARLCDEPERDRHALLAHKALLADLLRARPELLAELAGLLRSNTLDPAVASTALAAAGLAGTPRCQELLAEVAASAEDADVRLAAVSAGFEVEAPHPVLRERLVELAVAPASEPAVASTSLLVLGRFASATRRASEADFEHLVELQPVAFDRGLPTSWLHALGNSRDERAADLAAAYLDHPVPGVRMAARAALAKCRPGDPRLQQG